MRLRLLVPFAAAALVAVALATAFAGPSSPSRGVCTLYAATDGSASGRGSEYDPLASVQSLIDALEPGETGCLKQGIYTDPDDSVTFDSGGTSDTERKTLRSAPGEQAVVNAHVYVPNGSDYVTVRNLVLDGSRSPQCAGGATCEILPSVVVNGDHAVFELNEVTNRNKAICFNVGTTPEALPRGTIIRHNKIYDCGRIPSTNYDHGVYINHSRDAVVAGNWIYDNADRGIQLRKDADVTLVERNVIHGNGSGIIFSGDDGSASDGNTVRYNVITSSRDRYDVESWYPEGNKQGAGNVVYGNCIYGGAQGEIKSPAGGFEASDNVFRNPLYADEPNGDYSVRNDSCPPVWNGDLSAG